MYVCICTLQGYTVAVTIHTHTHSAHMHMYVRYVNVQAKKERERTSDWVEEESYIHACLLEGRQIPLRGYAPYATLCTMHVHIRFASLLTAFSTLSISLSLSFSFCFLSFYACMYLKAFLTTCVITNKLRFQRIPVSVMRHYISSYLLSVIYLTNYLLIIISQIFER